MRARSCRPGHRYRESFNENETITVKITKPDGTTTLGTWSGTTGTSGIFKLSVSLATSLPVGTYHVTATATKNAATGSATTSFDVQ